MYNQLLMTIIFLPLLGCLFVAVSRDNQSANGYNSLYSASLTIITNIMLILGLFFITNTANKSAELILCSWPALTGLKLSFKVDTFSLLLLLASHIGILTGTVGLRKNNNGRKRILLFSLFFLSTLNGYFSAADILTFFICFSLSVIPLTMLVGQADKEQKLRNILRFFGYNLINIFIFFIALASSLNLFDEILNIEDFSHTEIVDSQKLWIWGAIFIALISRLPLWPFYHWFSKTIKSIDNALVFICIVLLPTTGIYGLMRFWPEAVIKDFPDILTFLGILCLLTMLFAAITGHFSKTLPEKIFGFTVVYYLLYLSGVFLPTSILQINIAYSLFAFLILSGLLTVAVFHICKQQKFDNDSGILCFLPKISFIYGWAVLAGIGLPITALFWNNFIILSNIFDFSLNIGSICMISLLMISLALMNNWYSLKNKSCLSGISNDIQDIDKVQFSFYLLILIILLLSFIKPLWFVL